MRINRWIRAKEVRLIGETGAQLGVVPIEKALQIASERGLDLVEVASSSVPPVCRLLDYGRYRYEQTKKERKARKGQRGGGLKEIRVRPRMKEHDLETKIKIARKLLGGGDKVRFFVIFRGREITHPELGLKLLRKATDDLKDIAALDGTPSSQGRIMSLVLSPTSTKQIKKPVVEEKV
ncbi:MAG: translation initiation factor IF-3 [Chloroflexi bacterium]|nr:translation initiation factor IF-3 [Chloroflexota bacterium]MBL7061931.1 translation initiation factor IF-3 [Dehalococcoidia bacterium]